jgi:anti-sigma factor RsiW
MNLNCEHVSSYISEYIDGTVDPEARAEIENHLGTCESLFGHSRFHSQYLVPHR